MSGRRPFQELTEGFTADRRRRVETRKRELLAEMPLHELRQALAMTQQDVADRLQVNQPAIAKLEKRTDLYISSLRSYIEAVGGQLRIVASFPTGDVGITNFSSVSPGETVRVSAVDAFAEFLRNDVNLQRSRLARLETTVGAVNDYLKECLPGYQKMERQGSYALGTLIKPVDDNDEYDADIQVVMSSNPKWEPKDYILEINRTLAGNKTYADKLRLKTRCVTVDYAGDFHFDVVPCVTVHGSHHVCNRIDNKLEVTDGIGYRDWFYEQDRIAGGNLKRVVRLLKYLRDHKNSFTAKSILLTTLAGNTIKTSDEGTAAVSTVADTLETVLSRMNVYLQRHANMPEIKNPVLPTENFNRHWDQRRYANFRDRVRSYVQTAKQAKAEPSAEKSIEIWRDLFGDSFGKTASSDVGSGGTNGSEGESGVQDMPSRSARTTKALA